MIDKLCKHFPICGGCQIQDYDEDAQRKFKETHVMHSFQRHGFTPEIGSYHFSPLYSRRRAVLTAKRTKKTVQVGFIEAGTHNIIDISECRVIAPEIFTLREFAREITPLIGSRAAQLKFHVTMCIEGFDVFVENAKVVTPQVHAQIAQSCHAYNIRRLIIDDSQIYQDSSPQIDLAGVIIDLPPRPFLQATLEAEQHLRALAHGGIVGAETIVDLFCGIGTFSFGFDGTVDAYEGDEKLIGAMTHAVHNGAQHQVRPYVRDLFRDPVSIKELEKYQAAIIDPPRAGAQAQCEMLAASGVERIVFVSCDATTFARDARILVDGGYTMGPLQLVDQFRFANHIEMFALFTKSQ